MTVRLHPVWPEIIAHQSPCGMQLFVEERQRHLGRRDLSQLFQRAGFRLLERLHWRRRQPGMLLGQCAANAQQMHNWEDS
jgi:hypothetical protein